jgi:DNA-binding SARP family transcriptional activator
MPGLTLTLLGPPQLASDGAPIHLRSRKCIALLAYLAVSGVRQRRAALATLLWPESDRERAHNMLRTTLSRLRSALQGQWLVADRRTVGLDGSHEEAVDVLRFRSLLAQCQRHGHGVRETCSDCLPPLSEAVELYGGDFMDGFTLPDSVEFDTWQSLETEALRQDLVSALQRLVQGYAVQREVERAVACAKRWLTVDPLDEGAHRALMRLYAGSGQLTAALRQYETCEGVLRQELGVSPSEETKDLYQAIRGGRMPQLQVRALVVSAVPARPRHNLPVQPTAFVGREEELDEIAQRLADPRCRLLTVVGPGGMGKSRLAIQAGEEHLPAFSDGVWFVPLAALESVDLLASTIMEALDVPRYGSSDPRAQLLSHLRERHPLLILDNFEHLLEGTTLVTEMLAGAPGLKLLVTSRERLNLRVEWLFPLGGMGVPEEAIIQPGEGGDVIAQAVAVLEGYSAVELFVQCARQVQPYFSLVAAGAGWVARICQLVEGMPLAIELAAPWVRVMDCEEIAQEIEGGLDLLTTALHDAPQRHRFVRAVFHHSWGCSRPRSDLCCGSSRSFGGGSAGRRRRRGLGHLSSRCLAWWTDRGFAVLPRAATRCTN